MTEANNLGSVDLMAKPGPRPQLPRLESIDPLAFVAAVRPLMERLAETMAESIHADLAVSKAASLLLRNNLFTLAEWARTGSEDTTEAALETLPRVLDALYWRGIDGGRNGTPLNIRTMVGLTLVAARGRARLRRREPLEAVEIAALTGLSRRRVRQLIEAGELMKGKFRDGYESPVQHRSAQRFIRERATS